MPQDGDSPRQEETPSLQSFSRSPPRGFNVPKNRSAGNLLTLDTSRQPSDLAPKRASIAEGTAIDQTVFQSLSPVLLDPEHTIAPTGLNRIRQQPPSGPSMSNSMPSISRSYSMPFAIPSGMPSLSKQSSSSEMPPPTPSILGLEDLHRFTTESLHSFSFANQSDDFIHTRHSVLKRSIDFMRERLSWTGGNMAIATAQAKASGDPELQDMVELLSRTRMLGQRGEPQQGATFQVGPLTGPAEMPSENPFDASFAQQTESPTSMQPGGLDGQDVRPFLEDEDLATPTQGTINVQVHPPPEPRSATSPPPNWRALRGNPRSSLKRTFTDIAPLSLQSQLTEALGQPYVSNEDSLHTSRSSTGPATGLLSATGKSGPSSHAHGRAAPTTQAIFTTETKDPWTIAAANDLGCLIFGLSRAELRKISILEIFREDKRGWLQSRLKTNESRPQTDKPTSPKTSPLASSMGNGVTARLLRKPPSREARPPSLTKTRSDESEKGNPSALSRSVLLCGDVLPIRKRNGASGSATLWVQQKRGSLIWVMEEIAEDVALLSVDEIGSVVRSTGQSEAVFGMERVRRGMDITRLLPGIPRLKGTNTGALDYDEIASLRRFTARTSNDISIPVTVDRLSGESTFRVSSFPHIAGMMILNPSSLRVSSSNAVVSEALFGRATNGLLINDLIPGFDKMISHLVEEDDVELTEGMVIPEHSFRRARAMLAIREGKEDAAAVFLRPSSLPAIHRDGAEIMIDVQMRVVKSESAEQPMMQDEVIHEDLEDTSPISPKAQEMVYALWVTYSKLTHAANHGVGPISPLVSRPGTPPQQPAPGDAVPALASDDEESDHEETDKPVPPQKQPQEPHALPTPPDSTAGGSSAAPTRRTINDFTILEDMGAGAYGQVKLARPKTTRTLPDGQILSKIVIKYVTKARILVDTWTRDRKLGTVPLEIAVLSYLSRNFPPHPNIIEMCGFFEDDINYYIEMVPHGLPGMDLFDYIELRSEMSEEECRRMFVQVVEGVRFLHDDAKIIHRDIKDENVILDGEGRIKLIDFGSASYIRNGPFDVFVGTIDYAAPEVLAGVSYSGLEQDVWALGILLYTILYKENPFYSIDEIMDRDLRVPYVVSDESIALVRRMLDREVDRRPRVGDVARDAWCVTER